MILMHLFFTRCEATNDASRGASMQSWKGKILQLDIFFFNCTAERKPWFSQLLRKDLRIPVNHLFLTTSTVLFKLGYVIFDLVCKAVKYLSPTV